MFPQEHLVTKVTNTHVYWDTVLSLNRLGEASLLTGQVLGATLPSDGRGGPLDGAGDTHETLSVRRLGLPAGIITEQEYQTLHSSSSLEASLRMLSVPVGCTCLRSHGSRSCRAGPAVSGSQLCSGLQIKGFSVPAVSNHRSFGMPVPQPEFSESIGQASSAFQHQNPNNVHSPQHIP